MINVIKKLCRYIKILITSHLIKVNGKLIEIIPKDLQTLEIEGEKIVIEDKITIYETKWIYVVNPNTTRYWYREHPLREDEPSLWPATIKAGDTKRTVYLGEIQVLGFTDKIDGNMKVLVSHTSNGYNHEVYCPDGTKFLLEPKEFIKMRDIAQEKNESDSGRM